jgi:ABC-type phosphate/phosphonate transport system substrate-binding protein
MQLEERGMKTQEGTHCKKGCHRLFLKTTIFVALLIVYALALAPSSYAEVTIGVLAKRGASRVLAQWGPMGEYLTEKLGETVVIIPIDFDLIESMVSKGRIDFLLANSAFFVEMEERYQARAIATLINAKNHRPLDRFGGVLFTQRESPVKTLQDIRGKKLMLVQRSSFGGGKMALRLLLDSGINTQMLTLMEAGTHDNVVRAVQKGIAEVGTVRTDTLERMEAEGKIDMAELRVINSIRDDFSFVRSTRLYPEWPMAALVGTPARLGERMAKALKEMDPNMAASRAAYIIGWKDPANYCSVRKCLEALGEMTFPPCLE